MGENKVYREKMVNEALTLPFMVLQVLKVNPELLDKMDYQEIKVFQVVAAVLVLEVHQVLKAKTVTTESKARKVPLEEMDSAVDLADLVNQAKSFPLAHLLEVMKVKKVFLVSLVLEVIEEFKDLTAKKVTPVLQVFKVLKVIKADQVWTAIISSVIEETMATEVMKANKDYPVNQAWTVPQDETAKMECEDLQVNAENEVLPDKTANRDELVMEDYPVCLDKKVLLANEVYLVTMVLMVILVSKVNKAGWAQWDLLV